jgi:hypothetical protein
MYRQSANIVEFFQLGVSAEPAHHRAEATDGSVDFFIFKNIPYRAMAWRVDFYEEGDGNVPVEDFLNGLPKQQRAKAVALIRLLEEQGTSLPFPYSSQVQGRLRELRTRFGKTRLRILYFGDPRRTFVLLHGFVKAEEKLAPAELQIAEERMAAHLHRLERRK